LPAQTLLLRARIYYSHCEWVPVCVCKSVNFVNYIRTQSWVFERQAAFAGRFIFFCFSNFYGGPAMLSLLNANVSWPKTQRLWMSRKCNAAVACPWKCPPISARTADFWPEIPDLASRSLIWNALARCVLFVWSVFDWKEWTQTHRIAWYNIYRN